MQGDKSKNILVPCWLEVTVFQEQEVLLSWYCFLGVLGYLESNLLKAKKQKQDFWRAVWLTPGDVKQNFTVKISH